MRRVIIAVLGLVVLLAVAVGSGIAWLLLGFPRVSPAAALTVASTPESLARGRYLYQHVAACDGCHAQRDWTKAGAPPKPGTSGMGGERFGRDEDVPGEVHAPNITPAALASWSDGEILRSIACGVDREGTALFPLMPYPNYALLTQGDLESLVAHVRSLPRIENPVRERTLTFPMNLIVRTIPRDASPPPTAPGPEDEIARGRYLATAASCMHCHTPHSHGRAVAGKEWSGGVPFTVPGAIVRSANLTPDATTGLGAWTRERFVARFREGPEAAGVVPEATGAAAAATHVSPMPWTLYAGMTPEDLGAIFAYLRTLPPVANGVITVTPR